MKSNMQYLSILLLMGITLFSCGKPDLNKELEILASLQKQEQTAHLQEEPALLVNMLYDTLCQIKDGKVSFFTKDEMTERFITYFENVEFIKWEDSRPPIYTLSADGTMANILIQKRVELNAVQDSGSARESTDFAWTEMWKKKDGRWKMYQVTTTDNENMKQ